MSLFRLLVWYKNSRAMNLIIWILQGLLGFAFFGAGMTKLITPKPKLIEMFGDWVKAIPGQGMKLIGFLEVAGAIGLILPMALSILPILTVFAAIGLAMTMIGAIILHVQRKEFAKLVPNIVLLALSVFIIYGRLVLLPVN